MPLRKARPSSSAGAQGPGRGWGVAHGGHTNQWRQSRPGRDRLTARGAFPLGGAFPGPRMPPPPEWAGHGTGGAQVPPSSGSGSRTTGGGPAQPHLSDRVRQSLHDLLVRRGHHALPVDLNDAMAHADAASLRDAPAHEAADLSRHVSGQDESQPRPERGGRSQSCGGRRPQDSSSHPHRTGTRKVVMSKINGQHHGGVWETSQPAGPHNGVAWQPAEPLFHVGGEDTVGGSRKAHSGRFSASHEDVFPHHQGDGFMS